MLRCPECGSADVRKSKELTTAFMYLMQRPVTYHRCNRCGHVLIKMMKEERCKICPARREL